MATSNPRSAEENKRYCTELWQDHRCIDETDHNGYLELQSEIVCWCKENPVKYECTNERCKEKLCAKCKTALEAGAETRREIEPKPVRLQSNVLLNRVL